MNRRNFITGMAGILAAGSAPWVWTSGVMRPEQKIIVPEWVEYYAPTYPWNPVVLAELTRFADRFIRLDAWHSHLARTD